MTGHRTHLPNFKLSKSGKLEKKEGYGLSVSKKIAQRKSKKQRVVRRAPG